MPDRGKAPPQVTDAELACLAVAQVLLRCDGERYWLRAAPKLVGHLFPRLLAHREYNTRLWQLAPLMEAALRWLADATRRPRTAAPDGRPPVPCGTSAVTAKRSGLSGYAGYGYCASHSRWYWGCKLLLICTRDGTVTGFSLANPKPHGERDQARQTLERQLGLDATAAASPQDSVPASSSGSSSSTPASGTTGRSAPPSSDP